MQALDQVTGYLMAAAVLKGLAGRLTTGRGCRARCSLARTAQLLIDDASMSIEGDEVDLPDAPTAAEIEATSWGPARRVLVPAKVAGAPMWWSRPLPPSDQVRPSGDGRLSLAAEIIRIRLLCPAGDKWSNDRRHGMPRRLPRLFDPEPGRQDELGRRRLQRQPCAKRRQGPARRSWQAGERWRLRADALEEQELTVGAQYPSDLPQGDIGSVDGAQQKGRHDGVDRPVGEREELRRRVDEAGPAAAAVQPPAPDGSASRGQVRSGTSSSRSSG